MTLKHVLCRTHGAEEESVVGVHSVEHITQSVGAGESELQIHHRVLNHLTTHHQVSAGELLINLREGELHPVGDLSSAGERRGGDTGTSLGDNRVDELRRNIGVHEVENLRAHTTVVLEHGTVVDELDITGKSPVELVTGCSLVEVLYLEEDRANIT
jgi:hypothetical protein